MIKNDATTKHNNICYNSNLCYRFDYGICTGNENASQRHQRSWTSEENQKEVK